MSTPKRPDKKAASSWIAGGEDHQPKHQVRMAESRANEKAKDVAAIIGGRPKVFGGETLRLNIELPILIVKWIKDKAFDEHITPAKVLANILGPLVTKGK
jgi:hypothetical protein